ncbi:hypothetical protein ACWGJ2_33165 [Streptomyces sp. NPDC054796]
MSVYDLQGLKDETAFEVNSSYSVRCCNPSPDPSSWSAGCYHSDV